jgi:glycine dehydrogenase subunit 2
MKSNISSIFDKNYEGEHQNYVPEMDIKSSPLQEIIPKSFLREDLPIPNVPEIEIVRHFVNLSQKNYGVDTGIYPLGSCTMKYNPRINEVVEGLPGFSKIHPLQEECQGSLELLNHLSTLLSEITGMDAFSLQPAAGAHGELAGLLIIKKFFELKGIQKTKIIVPDSAHGTNPASAKMAGFSIVEIKSDDIGEVPLDLLDFAMKEGDVAGIMLTNPNTLGIFDRNIQEITRIVHENEGWCKFKSYVRNMSSKGYGI